MTIVVGDAARFFFGMAAHVVNALVDGAWIVGLAVGMIVAWLREEKKEDHENNAYGKAVNTTGAQ